MKTVVVPEIVRLKPVDEEGDLFIRNACLLRNALRVKVHHDFQHWGRSVQEPPQAENASDSSNNEKHRDCSG